MEVSRGMLPLEMITIVDDFITSGATAFGAFLRLSETFPDVPIRVFALVRSLSDDEADEIISPVIGSIKRRKNGLATRRP
jgi:adenine/guanine phosphoribosyltransferase-like PRPP-binding protein